jgi:parallel beta-helix repeat protein
MTITENERVYVENGWKLTEEEFQEGLPTDVEIFIDGYPVELTARTYSTIEEDGLFYWVKYETFEPYYFEPGIHDLLGNWYSKGELVYSQSHPLTVLPEGHIMTESFTFEANVYIRAGDPGLIIGADGIKIDGNKYALIGSPPSFFGISIIDRCQVKITQMFIQGFFYGIYIHDSIQLNINTNYLSDSQYGIVISNSNYSYIYNNIIANGEDNGGIAVSEYIEGCHINYNLFINEVNLFIPDELTSNALLNNWDFNFWSDYWGLDDGSNGRVEGDFIGDTHLPHSGVDSNPLLDPSIAEANGPLLYTDWWLVWRGGWSPVEIQMIDPYGRVINSEINEIGINAFYIEDNDWEPGTTKVMILRGIDPDNPSFSAYTFQMTALDDLDYSLEWFVSGRGEVLYYRSVENVPMLAGQTKSVVTEIDLNPDGSLTIIPVPQYHFSGFLEPINNDHTSVFKRGRTIPVKFQLFDDFGFPIDGVHATIEFLKVTDNIYGICEEEGLNIKGDLGDVFRFNPEDQQYIFNLSTKGYDTGTYVIVIRLDDGQIFSVYLSLR